MSDKTRPKFLLICSACAHLYDKVEPRHEGTTDPVGNCGGLLRPPTDAELLLIRQYRDLHKLFEQQAKELAKQRQKALL